MGAPEIHNLKRTFIELVITIGPIKVERADLITEERYFQKNKQYF